VIFFCRPAAGTPATIRPEQYNATLRTSATCSALRTPFIDRNSGTGSAAVPARLDWLVVYLRYSLLLLSHVLANSRDGNSLELRALSPLWFQVMNR